MKTKQKDKLNLLIHFCGGVSNFAKMLGLKKLTIYEFRRRGKISAIGVLLVERSRYLSKLFDRKYLRPDLSDIAIDKYAKSKKFLNACEKQDRAQQKSRFRKTPIGYLTGRIL